MMYRTLFLTFVTLHYSHASPSFPLLAWTTSDNQEKLPATTAGQTKPLSKVYSDYLKPMMQNKAVVLLFIQDELSADDFTKYSTSFPHLQKILQNEKYLLFPSVSKEKDDISQLIASSQGNVEHVDSGGLSDWKFKLPSEVAHTKFIIFNLEPISGSHSKGKAEILERNDLMMHRIFKSVHKEVKDVCVVYTAEEPSPVISNILLDEDTAHNGLVSRHLLSKAANATRNLFNSTNVMMHVRGIGLTRGGKKNTTQLIAPGASWVVNPTAAPSCSISITRQGSVGAYSDVTIAIKFVNKTSEWYCDELRVSGNYGNKSFDTTYNCGRPANRSHLSSGVYNNILAPSGMSYSCYKLTFVEKVSDQGGNHTDGLVLDGMQVQTMCDRKGALTRFSTTYDCVGFFTIEILTAIFVTIILMIGLYVGVMMMMAIQVQDRLDDPKGKTITVATASHD